MEGELIVFEGQQDGVGADEGRTVAFTKRSCFAEHSPVVFDYVRMRGVGHEHQVFAGNQNPVDKVSCHRLQHSLFRINAPTIPCKEIVTQSEVLACLLGRPTVPKTSACLKTPDIMTIRTAAGAGQCAVAVFECLRDPVHQPAKIIPHSGRLWAKARDCGDPRRSRSRVDLYPGSIMS